MSDARKSKAQLIEECQTLRQRVEALESRQHVLIEDVLDSPAVGLCILDKGFHIAWINTQLERFFGLRRGELLGKDARQFTHDHIRGVFEDPDAFSENVFASYENGTYGDILECHLLPNDGRVERWLERRTDPIRSGLYAGGRIDQYYDITDRKRAEHALQHSEARYNALAEKTFDIIAEFDSSGRFAYLSPSSEISMGFAPGELLGRHFTCVIRPEEVVEVNQGFKRALGPGAIESQMIQIRHKDGSWRWIEGTAFRFETPSGETRLLGIGRDVTEQKRMEEQLVRSERLASIGTLAAGIAHEINNPLGGTLLAAQFALEFKDDSAAVTNALKAIVRQTKRCAEVVSGVLQFAREGRSDRHPVDLNSVVQHARDLIRSYAEERGSTIELVLADDLPTVSANETEMVLVIVNVIRNAVDASAKHIHLRTQRVKDCVQLTVQDNGSGIAADHEPHIFEPFYTTREKQGGTGLGLSIAYGIVTGHEGTIDVRSEQGKGTTLTIRLPAAGDGDGQRSDR